MYNNNIKLNLPFDESNGSKVAYDYSANRADCVVDGATFVPGKNGNAISFHDSGTCEVAKNVLGNINGEWTISTLAKGLSIETGSPKQMVWVLNFGGVDDTIEVPIDVSPDLWISLAVTKKGNSYKFYANGSLVKNVVRSSGTLRGISLNQDAYGGEDGLGCLDDFKIYDVELSQDELMTEQNEGSTIEYTIDGVNIKNAFGVCVSNSEGVISKPKLKTPTSMSWDNYHGEVVDLYHKFYEPREITLSCFLKASSKNDFITRLVEFEQLFDKPGTQRLMISVHPIKPLVYEIYNKNEIAVKKTWNERLMVGTFDLKLTEPEPVKRVLKHIRVSDATKDCTITLTSNKNVNIYWGDGESDLDVSGTNKTVSHTYKDNGDYFIIIAGCVDEITDFATNAIIVWNKL